MKIFEISVLVLIIGLVLLIYFAVTTEAEYLDAKFKEVENCEVIGDATDLGPRSHYTLRKIYKCPDGMIRIR